MLQWKVSRALHRTIRFLLCRVGVVGELPDSIDPRPEPRIDGRAVCGQARHVGRGQGCRAGVIQIARPYACASKPQVVGGWSGSGGPDECGAGAR